MCYMILGMRSRAYSEWPLTRGNVVSLVEPQHILDEIQAPKNIYDMGLVERGYLKIIIAGSRSMSIAEATSKLRDGQGRLVKLFNSRGNLVYVPLRFSKAVEVL